MSTAKKGYYLKDGVTRVPSVTTILGRFKEAGGLMHWAWDCGMQGLDYRKVRDAAADAGTLAHAAVDDWIHQRPVTFDGDPAICEKARIAFAAFLEWANQTQLTVTHTEMPLVSERHKFGGTFDAILVKGKRSMGDWKTSRSVYPEYLAQIAAYAILWEENFITEPIDGGFHLLRFDKEFGDFHAHWWSELEAGKRYFLALRSAYAEDRELRDRSK